MSTPERSDDPGEHGYGGVKQDSNLGEAKQDQAIDDDREDVVPSDKKRKSANGDWPS